jgi:hypothetical protein
MPIFTEALTLVKSVEAYFVSEKGVASLLDSPHVKKFLDVEVTKGPHISSIQIHGNAISLSPEQG